VVCDAYAARLLAHAIRTIEGQQRDGRLGELEIHQSFVTAELGQRDDSRRDQPALPAGVGTLLAAAECARAGGERLEVFGAQSKSLDIEFRGSTHATLRIESKARALARVFAPGATPETLTRWALHHMLDAGRLLRARTKSDGVHALQIVCLSAFAPLFVANDSQCKAWPDRVAAHIREAGRPRPNPFVLPHAVVTHWLTVETEGVIGAKGDGYFGFTHLLDYARPRPPEPAIELAMRVFARAAAFREGAPTGPTW